MYKLDAALVLSKNNSMVRIRKNSECKSQKLQKMCTTH